MKGAAGQAVQAFNIVFGLPEASGPRAAAHRSVRPLAPLPSDLPDVEPAARLPGGFGAWHEGRHQDLGRARPRRRAGHGRPCGRGRDVHHQSPSRRGGAHEQGAPRRHGAGGGRPLRLDGRDDVHQRLRQRRDRRGRPRRPAQPGGHAGPHAGTRPSACWPCPPGSSARACRWSASPRRSLPSWQLGRDDAAFADVAEAMRTTDSRAKVAAVTRGPAGPRRRARAGDRQRRGQGRGHDPPQHGHDAQLRAHRCRGGAGHAPPAAAADRGPHLEPDSASTAISPPTTPCCWRPRVHRARRRSRPIRWRWPRSGAQSRRWPARWRASRPPTARVPPRSSPAPSAAPMTTPRLAPRLAPSSRATCSRRRSTAPTPTGAGSPWPSATPDRRRRGPRGGRARPRGGP